jgi:hypothetical protein
MNVKLLREVQQYIREEPRRMNMDKGIAGSGRLSSNMPPCATVCCIAGAAVLLHYGVTKDEIPYESIQPKFGVSSDGSELSWNNVRVEAILALELDFLPYQELFYVHNWPELFYDKIDKLRRGTPEYVEVVCERIDAFIEQYAAA